ncbi:MAG: hypothetical protein LBL58_19570 [Tannerellaceae bacterium]|jgi:hypothetical protein|nr:hypothetical protein [Tannerellaceae bacterium]
MKTRAIDPDFIFDFFTCSPLTMRGKNSLRNLGIENIVDEEFFFNNIHVESRFDSFDGRDIDDNENPISDIDDVGEPFRNSADIRKTVASKNGFYDRLINRTDYLFEISATPGSGKTTELHYILHRVKPFFRNKTFNLVYDLEVMRSSVRIGKQLFQIPVGVGEDGSTHWMFFAQCLDSLCNLIFYEVKSKGMQEKVSKNFKQYFNNEESRERATEEEESIFKAITSPESASIIYLSDLYNAIDKQIDRSNVESSIGAIFSITLLLLICIEPDNMNFVVIDNIEHYIRESSGIVIPWYDEDVNELAVWLSGFVEANRSLFAIFGLDFSKHFKIISVIRKTSNYVSLYTQYFAEQYSIDMSNWFSFEWLYMKRKMSLLPHIQAQGLYADNGLNNVFNILDVLIADDTAFTVGHSLVDMLSSMCNSNIRRIAASISEIAINIFWILHDSNSNSNSKSISLSQFKKFWSEGNNRFLMRRAALQCLLSGIVSQSDFGDLKLGTPRNTIISSETVGTLTNRILVLLSRRSRSEDNIDFVKLHELVQAAYVNVRCPIPRLNLTYHFKPLADVLCALNRPFYKKPLTAPWIIIRYNENVIADSNILAKALEEAWDDYLTNGSFCNKYPVNKYGVRITRSGYFFVSTIHSDFSFFAALYCNEKMPIMFLKNVSAVIAQIDKVCDKATKYIDALNVIDMDFFGVDLAARKSSFGRLSLEREHLFRTFIKGDKKEFSLQELIVYRVHMFLVHYQRFLETYGLEVFGGGNSALLTYVKQKIEELKKAFEVLKNEHQVVSTTELFRF